MITRIQRHLPLHSITSHSYDNIYVADYKNHNNGDVVILDTKPNDIACVHIANPNKISIYFDGFKDQALPLPKKQFCKQCECVLFTQDQNTWALFIEMKYAVSEVTAFDIKRDYPNVMINQIIETVSYFRSKTIIPNDKIVHALVSFPNLVMDFNATLFSKSQTTIEDILGTYKIIIRASNKASIRSQTTINLS